MKRGPGNFPRRRRYLSKKDEHTDCEVIHGYEIELAEPVMPPSFVSSKEKKKSMSECATTFFSTGTHPCYFSYSTQVVHVKELPI